jgi:hypothetical protein
MWLLPTAYTVTWSRRPPSRKRTRAAGTSDGDDRDPEEPVLLLRRQRLLPTTTDGDPTTPPAPESLSERIEFCTKRLNEFLAEQLATLPSDAEVDTLEIGKASLPEKDAASAHQHNHARLQEISKKSALAVTSSELEAALAAPVPKDLETLPKWLIDRVRRQEQHTKKASQRTDAAQQRRLYTTLPQLSDQIQSLVLVQRKHVFPLREMTRQLLVKAPIRDQIDEQLHLLETMVPFWLTVFFSDGKQYVKVSKSHKYNAVKSALRKALGTMAG